MIAIFLAIVLSAMASNEHLRPTRPKLEGPWRDVEVQWVERQKDQETALAGNWVFPAHWFEGLRYAQTLESENFPMAGGLLHYLARFQHERP